MQKQSYWPQIVSTLLTAVVTLIAVFLGSILTFQQQNLLKIQEERRTAFADLRSLEFKIKTQLRRHNSQFLLVYTESFKEDHPELFDAQDRINPPPRKEFESEFKENMQQIESSMTELYRVVGKVTVLFPDIDVIKLERLISLKNFSPQLPARIKNFKKEIAKTAEPHASRTLRFKELLKKLSDDLFTQLDRHEKINIKAPFEAVYAEMKNEMNSEETFAGRFLK